MQLFSRTARLLSNDCHITTFCLTEYLCVQLFTRRAARLLYKNQRVKRWCFDVELIYLAQQLRIPIAEVPVEWREVPGKLVPNDLA